MDYLLWITLDTGAIHSTKISGNFGPKLNGSVRSNRKSFEKTGPPFEVDQFSRSDRLEFWLNGSRPEYEIRGGNLRIATIFWRENGRKGEEVSSEECQKLRRFSIRCSLFLSLSASYFLFTPNFKLI